MFIYQRVLWQSMIYLPTSLGDVLRANVTPSLAAHQAATNAQRGDGMATQLLPKKKKTWSLNEENVEKLSSISL